jgi:uncharacterized NAD(P)/FAD-binding protein YdhS
MAETDLAIIGGGASAILLLAALAKNPAAKGMRVDLYERSMARLGRGIAYSTQHTIHLLNVRACDMSAFVNDKDDFANWVEERGFKPAHFVPRKIYGEYLIEKLNEAKKILTLNITEADVTAVKEISGEEYEITYNNRKRSYMCVVQATGNVRPQRPKVEGNVAGYYDDPWSADFATLGKAAHIALVGSGLTAIDMVLALYAKNYTGKISIYSRHALMPAAHVEPITWPSFLDESDYKKTPYALLHAVRQEVKKAKKQGIPWQAVIDSLRPHINPVWHAMTRGARERFMKRLFTLWNVHRHRMAPQIAEAVKTLEKAGRVEFVKSSVEKITAGPTLHGSAGAVKIDAIINCLGYRYREEGRGFEPTEKIGPARFGDEFETTAIPEIRAQAADIVARILKKY